MMTIPVIFSTGSLYTFDLDTAMALAAEAGFTGVELMVDWRRETYEMSHLEKLMHRHDLPILAVHSPFFHLKVPGWPSDPAGIVKQSVQLAEALGAQTVVVHPPGRWLRFQGVVASPYRHWQIMVPVPVLGVGSFGRWLWFELPEFQAGTGVKIAVENMPRRRFGPFKFDHFHYTRSEQLAHFQYLTLDTTHIGTRQIDLLNFYREVKDKVAHVHLSNYNGQEHQLLTNGHLPLTSLLTELARDKFAGLISVELSPDSLQSNDEETLKQNLRDTVSFCRNILAEKT